MPQLDMSTWPPQLIWLAITFFALYFVMSRVAIPGVGGVIQQRKSTIEGDLAAAQRLKAETESAITAYEESLAAARSKAQGIATENRNTLNAEIDGERAKLDAALGSKIAAAEKKIAASKDSALADVAAVAADMASQIVAQLTGAKITKAAASAAVARPRGK
jgi:F-type H+-transporting ATPase subunit b